MHGATDENSVVLVELLPNELSSLQCQGAKGATEKLIEINNEKRSAIVREIDFLLPPSSVVAMVKAVDNLLLLSNRTTCPVSVQNS